MQLIQPNNHLGRTFRLPRGYFPLKYRLSGFDYKDITDFTSFGADYFQKPFPQEFIDFIVLDGFGSTDTLKTYYGITVSGSTAIPNGLGTGVSVNGTMLAAMQAWLLARYGGELANFDMPMRILVRDLMEKANKDYNYPTSNIISPTQIQNLKEFALITKSDPVRVKIIKFSDFGGNSRKQYEENMIYFQTDGDTEIKQKIKPSVGRSAKDKNTEIITIKPTKEMIFDGLRDLDVTVIGDESFLTLFELQRQANIIRIKAFLTRQTPLLFFNASSISIFPPASLLILPFTPPPALNLNNGVGITVLFDKVRPDFAPAKRMLTLTPTIMPTPTLMPTIVPTPIQEQIKINSFDEETIQTPKSNIVAIAVVVLVLLVGIVIVGES